MSSPGFLRKGKGIYRHIHSLGLEFHKQKGFVPEEQESTHVPQWFGLHLTPTLWSLQQLSSNFAALKSELQVRCIFYATHHCDMDADFHSYRKGSRNEKDKLGHLTVCSCEIHFKIAALQAWEVSLDSMEILSWRRQGIAFRPGCASRRATYVPIKKPLYDQSFCAYVINSDNLQLIFGEEPRN